MNRKFMAIVVLAAFAIGLVWLAPNGTIPGLGEETAQELGAAPTAPAGAAPAAPAAPVPAPAAYDTSDVAVVAPIPGPEYVGDVPVLTMWPVDKPPPGLSALADSMTWAQLQAYCNTRVSGNAPQGVGWECQTNEQRNAPLANFFAPPPNDVYAEPLPARHEEIPMWIFIAGLALAGVVVFMFGKKEMGK